MIGAGGINTLRTLLAGVLFFASAAAFAQGYPSRPIRLIVPFTPGGSTDILGRAIGQKLATAIATARREHVDAVLMLPSPAFNRYRSASPSWRSSRSCRPAANPAST